MSNLWFDMDDEEEIEFATASLSAKCDCGHCWEVPYVRASTKTTVQIGPQGQEICPNCKTIENWKLLETSHNSDVLQNWLCVKGQNDKH
jgi:hypothetical protein